MINYMHIHTYILYTGDQMVRVDVNISASKWQHRVKNGERMHSVSQSFSVQAFKQT